MIQFRIEEYKKVQHIAKIVLEEIKEFINANKSEKEIVEKCKSLLIKHGITETWYYNCPALVLFGSRSCLSISGKNYVASAEKVGNENLVTIDLSPLSNGIWGDCARSFVVEDGKIKSKNEVKNPEFIEGLEIERHLHRQFMKVVKPGKSFEEIYSEMNELIKCCGYENLDFNGNVGHTIETEKDKRLYFEKGNKLKIEENMLFTFEPHIRRVGKKYGFKLENIYYFAENSVKEL